MEKNKSDICFIEQSSACMIMQQFHLSFTKNQHIEYTVMTKLHCLLDDLFYRLQGFKPFQARSESNKSCRFIAAQNTTNKIELN